MTRNMIVMKSDITGSRHSTLGGPQQVWITSGVEPNHYRRGDTAHPNGQKKRHGHDTGHADTDQCQRRLVR